jgi:aryl-alcohol dehydrogenase-like predicted oxidoreductase
VAENVAVETTTLGRTGLIVTPVGLGLAALGRPAYINLGRDQDLGSRRSISDMAARCRTVLDAAYAAGVRYFDGARSYGYAERFLATWLRDRSLAPGSVTIGSKWGYTYVADWRLEADVHEVKDHSLAALERQYAETRELLGESLGLYQIHSATIDIGVLQNGSVLAALAAIADTGIAIGLSLSGPRQADALRVALEVEIDGINPFSCVQATLNPLEPSAGEALRDAHAEHWGVIAKEVLANGRLAPHDGEGLSGIKRAIVDGVAHRYDAAVDALAFSWVLSHEFVDVALSGAVTTGQLESNLTSLELELATEELDALTGLAEGPEEYWATRKGLSWG